MLILFNIHVLQPIGDYYYYYYKSKDFSDASQKVAGALYKVTVCAVQVALKVKKSAKAVSHWNDS